MMPTQRKTPHDLRIDLDTIEALIGTPQAGEIRSQLAFVTAHALVSIAASLDTINTIGIRIEGRSE